MKRLENVKREIHWFEVGGIWVSVATNFMLWIYAPLELLFTNQDEFWFDVYTLTSMMAIVFAVMAGVSILGFIVLQLISSKLYKLALVLYFIAFICLYVQGNFLTEGLPPLDGSTIDWSLYIAEKVKSVAVWVIIPVILIIIYRLKSEGFLKAVKIVSICMTLMLGITLMTLAVTNHGFVKKPNMGITSKNISQMSLEKNFVILVLDAADGQVMGDMLESSPEYQSIFTDFTFYNNMVTAYPFTKFSVPYILSGKWYEHPMDFNEYEQDVYATSPLFETLERSGYSMGVYTEGILPDSSVMERFENILPNERGIVDKWAFARWQMLMTGFRYAPYDLKRFSFVNPNAFKELKLSPEGEELYTLSNMKFYNDVCQQEIQYTDQPCFKFIHIEGAHEPFIYDENVNVIENGTYEDNLLASLTITEAYLDKLKKSGVYDNSIIIVMADHGFHENWKEIYRRIHPIFFVKGMKEQHEFQTSDAPLSFEDLQEAYQRLLKGQIGEEIFDWKSGDNRDRRFLYYEYEIDDYLTECIQSGQASNIDTIYKTGNIYKR